MRDFWTLSDLESLVTNAEATGGWVPVVFHHVCDNDCNPYSVTPATFGAFLAWLQSQPVSVQTVQQVIGGSVQPAVSAPQVPPAPPGTNGVANALLETGDQYNVGTPACWKTTSGGTNSPSFAESANAHSGSVAETVTMSNYAGGDAKFITAQDLGQCAPSAVAGNQYVTSAWYSSTVPTRFSLYSRDTNGGWHFWTQSPQFPASGPWTQATWGTPAVPAGATALSFGMNIAANGTLSLDDLSLADTGGPPTNPSVSLTGPAPGANLSGQVTFTANASSAAGISKVGFLVNGVVVVTATSAPYTATWDSTTVGDGPVTVTARATDIAGSQATTPGQSDTVSNAAGRGGNMLANASLETYTGTGSAPDCWTQGGTGTSTYTWSKTASAHGGSWAQNVTITSYTSGDRKLVTAQNASGSWVYWTQSKAFAASSSWKQATWTTPAVPSGAVALSFGLNLAAAGSLTTDDYTMTGN